MEIVKKYKPILNQNQLNYIVKQYIKTTKDENILKVKDQFDLINVELNSSKRYIQCNYNLNTNSLTSSSEFIFEINTKEMLSFEFILH